MEKQINILRRFKVYKIQYTPHNVPIYWGRCHPPPLALKLYIVLYSLYTHALTIIRDGQALKVNLFLTQYKRLRDVVSLSLHA